MDSDEIAYMVAWADQYECALQTKGQVGFGRDCVGITWGDNYIDYTDWNLSHNEPQLWTPPHSYHKTDCLAVLGWGDEPLKELYIWIKWLDENDFIVETDHETKAVSGMNAILGLPSQKGARITRVGVDLPDLFGDLMRGIHRD